MHGARGGGARGAYGRFPQSYRDVLLLCGKGAGALVDDREVFLFADQLERINADGWEALRLYREDGYAPEVPERAVFVADRYGEHPQFILTGERADSPVLMFNTDLGVVTQVAGSVWEWMGSFAAGRSFFSGAGWEAEMPGAGRVERPSSIALGLPIRSQLSRSSRPLRRTRLR